MNDLFFKYKELLFRAEVGVLKKKNLLNQPRKTYQVKGKQKYGRLIQDEFLDHNNTAIYHVEYFISYDHTYQYISIKDVEQSVDYEREELI